ncbi:MAG: hypothetical protein ACLFU7_07980 [Armatimonadota bacterium]
MMEALVEQLDHLQFLNQFWLTLFFLIPMVLVARAVVAGTRYSPILIIVVFGLAMGFVLTSTGVTDAGLTHFPMVGILSRTTIVALTAIFFVGGQELRRTFSKTSVPEDKSVMYCMDEIIFGTCRTHLVFIIRAFFLLLGIEGVSKLILGTSPADAIGTYYPLIAYFGLVVSLILIDNRAVIKDKQHYLRLGLFEIIGIVAVLFVSYHITEAVSPLIALPQIFFAMIVASALGMLLYRVHHGPTIRCLLFAGIPIILAANFMVGGSLISHALSLTGVAPVLVYGFFGQLFWMFGGMALLMLFAGTAAIRNLGPGMAGALSHAGLTGACTGGDFGEEAATRAPIMINIPFFGHIFVFSVLALSVSRGSLLILPTAIFAGIGLLLTIWSFMTIRKARGERKGEISGLIMYSMGWQLTAVFGGLLLLTALPLEYLAMAKSAALSHFGLFAAVQEGMFGVQAAEMISFVFAMPFLVHPLVFFVFGLAMENQGEMPRKPIYALALIGLAGVLYGLIALA